MGSKNIAFPSGQYHRTDACTHQKPTPPPPSNAHHPPNTPPTAIPPEDPSRFARTEPSPPAPPVRSRSGSAPHHPYRPTSAPVPLPPAEAPRRTAPQAHRSWPDTSGGAAERWHKNPRRTEHKAPASPAATEQSGSSPAKAATGPLP